MIQVRAETDPQASAARFQAAADEVSPSGLQAKIAKGVGQLVRFSSSHIEVRTGRTKNSIYGDVRASSGGVIGTVGATSSYHQYVRDDGHGQQFLRFAAHHELPRVLKDLGEDVRGGIREAFES